MQEIESRPEFIEKALLDEANSEHAVHPSATTTAPRVNGWFRKRAYRKKLIRRFLSINPALNISEMAGTHPRNAVYISDFTDGYWDWRHEYNINVYEKLYIAPAGDIRLCKKRVIHHRGNECYLIGPSEIPDAKKFTNRRIRSKLIREDDRAPSSPAYYKKAYSRLIDNTI